MTMKKIRFPCIDYRILRIEDQVGTKTLVFGRFFCMDFSGAAEKRVLIFPLYFSPFRVFSAFFFGYGLFSNRKPEREM